MTEQLKQINFDKKIDCEALLIHLIQSKNRASLQDIVDRLESLEQTPSSFQEVTLKEPVNSLAAKPEPVELPQAPIVETASAVESDSLKPVQFYDTIMQFAATELEGSLKK